MFLTTVHGLLYNGLKTFIEGGHHFLPLFFALSNLIEVLLHLSGEVVVHNLLEMFHQEVVNHDADVSGEELALF